MIRRYRMSFLDFAEASRSPCGALAKRPFWSHGTCSRNTHRFFVIVKNEMEK